MADAPLVSVVIPVWRDERPLAQSLRHIGAFPQGEVIVAYDLSEERRYVRHRDDHPAVRWVSAPRGRAVQMNAGAAIARGEWLLFLHADSTLPPAWMDEIAAAGRDPGVVGGAFRLRIASQAWQARVVEWGVRLRVALLGLPYGDQALFVRRGVFEGLGGYRDLPLMEDVDLVRRVRRSGRLVHARAAVLTSARRWKHDGWFRRSGENLRLAARFLSGESAARLAQAYYGRKPGAVVMMARAPWTAGKTRVGIAADEASHAELRRALFLDTLDRVTAVSGAEHIVACEPADACEEMRALVGPSVDVIAQRGDDLGQRMRHALEDVFRLGCESVILVGSDLPDLPSSLMDAAFAHLGSGGHDVVLGPSSDGGYYLIGMNRLHQALLDGIPWSTERVLPRTLEAAAAEGIRSVLLDSWTDVDDDEDLDRLIARPRELTANRTRLWASTHLQRG